jgi:2-oxoglutarate ferredoxin oxidoreductase subunit alpha
MTHFKNTISIKISAKAGEGALSAGDILMNAAASCGYHSSIYKVYSSSVRDGHCSALVTFSNEQILSAVSSTDILFVLNEQFFDSDNSLRKNCLIIIEEQLLTNIHYSEFEKKIGTGEFKIISAPLNKLSLETADSSQLKSMVTIGIITSLLKLPLETIQNSIQDHFQNKRPDIIRNNLAAMISGYRFASENFNYNFPLNQSTPSQKEILEGNQAIAQGALFSGCRFFASYPITPATSIGEYLARRLPEVNGFAYQAEDEIAAIGAAIGASFSGVKSMTATSGPGLSLMQEFIGYASATQIPVVIVDVQRPGPSTGMPTRHAQEDLLAAAFGGHGEGQRIVLAPVDLKDCFSLTAKSFDIAEKYKCPVIILSDGSTASVRATIERKELDQLKETLKHDSMSEPENQSIADNPEAAKLPQSPGVCRKVSGMELNDHSLPANNNRERTLLVEKRFSPLHSIEKEISSLIEWDLGLDKSAAYDFCIIAWGLNASISKEAIRNLREQGLRPVAMYPRLLFPVCKSAIGTLLSLSKTLIIPESNYTGQYSRLVKMYTGADPVSILSYGGEPLTPDQLTEKIVSIVNRKRKHQ